MKKKRNFYNLLDIDRKATPSEIKKAYRKAAKKYHPDVSRKGEEKFKHVQEAYDTLSDPEKKTVYDENLSAAERPQVKVSVRPSPAHDDMSFHPLENIDDSFSDWEDFWSDFMPDFFGRRRGGSREQFVEILLTSEEASGGGEISLSVPLRAVCRRCGGTGARTTLICGRCLGTGEERLEKRIMVNIPPGVRDGTRARFPVTFHGTDQLDLVVTVRVGRFRI